MRGLERTLLDLSVLAVILLCGVIVANVVLRAGFGGGLPDAIILVRELMIAAIILPLSAATAARAHVAVTFLTDRMSPGLRGRLILFGHVVALIALLPLLYASGRMALQGWQSGEFYYGDLNLPRWPGLVLFWAGIALMWVRLWIMLIADARALRETGMIVDEHGQEAI